jgi:large subunit ribosomal protein L6
MSRIGSMPVEIPQGVEVKIEEKSRYGGPKIIIKGKLGELFLELKKPISSKVVDNTIVFERKNDSKSIKSLHGMYRSIIASMITGVTEGFEKRLEIVGMGYKAELQGSDLSLSVGKTHPQIIKANHGVTFEVEDKVKIKVKGIDKQAVGQIAAEIRSLAKAEPYKGKGIRYEGEYVRRKVGKVAKTASES